MDWVDVMSLGKVSMPPGSVLVLVPPTDCIHNVPVLAPFSNVVVHADMALQLLFTLYVDLNIFKTIQQGSHDERYTFYTYAAGS
jgi:hypothetical protein